MKKVLILDNSVSCVCNFRFELVEKLINEGFMVYVNVPESSDNDKVKSLSETGACMSQVTLERRTVNPIKELKLIRDYKKIISKIKPDCILTYTIKPNIYGNIAASKYSIPAIINITGLGSSLQENSFKYIVKWLYKLACRKASYVYFQNTTNRDFFIENHMVDPNKIKVIPGSGVNVGKFTPMAKQTEDEKLRFLFIGRLMREKGIDEYIEAANYVTAKYPNTEFHILGSYEELLYKKKIENISNPQLKYLGYSKDVRKQIKNVDCIVNPSYHEGMSNVLLEGASMGKPLIASNIPGCREIIDDNINGYLFDVKSSSSLIEKIVSFINLDQKDRDDMGKVSREKAVREFDRKLVVDEYIRTIKSLIGDRIKI